MRISARLIRVGWLVVGAGIVIAVGAWSTGIGGVLSARSHPYSVPTPPPVHAIPMVVTEYSNAGTLDKDQLCGELAPSVNSVIVENPLGYIDATIQC